MATTDKPDERLLNPDVASLALGTLKSNSRLNFSLRVLAMLFALGASILAVTYVFIHADEMVQVLTDPARDSVISEQLLALTAPALLLMIFAVLAALGGMLAHSRGLDESVRTLDSVNRLRREGEVAVSARGLIVAFEEQLASAKRGHTLLLWIGRTLFIVTLGLFVAAFVSAIWHGVDALTVGLGASSLAGAVLGVATKMPESIAHDVANVVQLQLVVTGAHRQIGMLESDAFASLNNPETARGEAHRMLLEVQDRIDNVVDTAIKQIEKFADPQPEAQVIQFRRPKAA